MSIEIINVFSNEVMTDRDFKGGHGQSFLIQTENHKILFDVGSSGKKLLHNLHILGITPDEIDGIIFSHGHYDHTDGLPAFLDVRTPSTVLPIYGHPQLEEQKVGKVLFFKKDIGFPSLTPQQRQKIAFNYISEPQELFPGVWISGIIKNRHYRTGIEPNALHKEGSEFVVDPVLDDYSVYLQTPQGTVIITGCAHAGLLNICQHAHSLFGDPIVTILGGSHMVHFTEEEVREFADIIQKEFGSPHFYLNHCTNHLPLKFRPNYIVQEVLSEKFGEGKVGTCKVGSRFEFFRKES